MVAISAIRIEDSEQKSLFTKWGAFWEYLPGPVDDEDLRDWWNGLGWEERVDFYFAFTPDQFETFLLEIETDPDEDERSMPYMARNLGESIEDFLERLAGRPVTRFMVRPGKGVRIGDRQIVYTKLARNGNPQSEIPRRKRTTQLSMEGI